MAKGAASQLRLTTDRCPVTPYPEHLSTVLIRFRLRLGILLDHVQQIECDSLQDCLTLDCSIGKVEICFSSA
jgi:hypothetical protein